jgi:glycosyltransferase involved in cell wall biosynthesis
MIAYTSYANDARVRRQAETLVSHGFRVLCLTTNDGTRGNGFVLNGVQVRQLGVRKYRGPSTIAYLSSYLYLTLFAAAACLGLLLRRELDVVHVHNMPDFLVLAGLLPRLFGKKLILDVHDSMPETFAAKFADRPALRRLLCLEERLSAHLAHRVICVNHPQRDTLVARGIPNARTFVSMNVPDPAIFKPPLADGRPPIQTGKLNLVYHGTMARRLGVDLIIQAVAELRARVPGLHLHLWGHGDDLPGFQRLAVDLGLEGTVSFNADGYPLEALPRRLSSMDLGVVGNRRSAACDLMLPVKLLEYVSLEIPAVVPRLRAIERYFSDDMVTYYEPEDVRSLADAIHRLSSQPSSARRQARTAHQFLQTYGWERQGAEFVSFYRQLLER